MGIRYLYGVIVIFMPCNRYPYEGNRWIVGIYLIPAVFSPFYQYLRRI